MSQINAKIRDEFSDLAIFCETPCTSKLLLNMNICLTIVVSESLLKQMLYMNIS